MSYLLLFALGAAGGLIGDQGHVASGTTRYIDHGVPFIWESAIWFVGLVGLLTVTLAEIRIRLGPGRPGAARDGVLGVAAVIGLYAVTALVRDAPLGPATALVYALGALGLALIADRPALICAGLAAVSGTVGEIILVRLDVFAYAPDSDALLGVAPWLPGLYLLFGAVAARLGELLLRRQWIRP